MAYNSAYTGQQIDEAVGSVKQKESTWDGKQDKLTGTQGQVVGFDESGNAVAQKAPENGITQDQADGRYLQMQGTTTVPGSIGAAPYSIEFTEETEDAPVLTFGPQSVAATSFTSDTTYEGWGFRAAVPLTGVTADYVPSVTFGIADATGGNLAPVADSYAGGVYIYAKEQPTAAVSVASVVCVKGV